MFFIAYHGVSLIIFAVAVVVAGRKVSKLRSTSAPSNSWLLPFAYFSLSSWIVWALQYVILLTGSFISFPSGYLQDTGLWLGVIQNALWASAVFSLHSKQFLRMSLTVPLLMMFSIVIGLVTYLTPILSSEPFREIDAVSGAAIFTIFAYWIVQLRLSKISAATFFIHGYLQWIWRSLWINPFTKSQLVLLTFPLWRIALLVAWIALISEMLVTLRVMISSTVKDLVQEREATERAIAGLHLTGFRAETFGSVPGTPEETCAAWAQQCDIFVLIIGQRYGYVIQSMGKSVVEFEYDEAYCQDPRKILVYVKDGVKRELRLEEFLKRLQHFEHGHVTSTFSTPDELSGKIQHDVKRWLTSHREAEITKRRAGLASPSIPS